MDVKDLMSKITDYSKTKKNDEKKAMLEKAQRIDDLKDAIAEKGDKITELIKLGNHALNNNVIISKDRYFGSPSLENRGYGYFFTDGFHHALGFVWDNNLKKITHLGIEGGGACNYDLKLNQEDIEATGDREYVLTRFVNELDEFEEDLVKYITKTIEKK